MSSPVRRVVGTLVAVETSVLYETDQKLDTNHDHLVDVREAGSRWQDISEYGQQIEADRRRGYYGETKDDSVVTQAAVAGQQLGANAGSIASGFALRGGARTLRALAPYLRPGPIAVGGQMLAEGADIYLQREEVTGPNLLRRGANVAYEGVTWFIASIAGAGAGAASTPFVTLFGAPLVAFGTSVAVKSGIDCARNLLIETVARSFGY
ncbi:MAG: hypothetical protein H7Z43_04590 [Clostridia bacterium]|nr:hypothetical protein [Deltaproteobacteria bacterium]